MTIKQGGCKLFSQLIHNFPAASCDEKIIDRSLLIRHISLDLIEISRMSIPVLEGIHL